MGKKKKAKKMPSLIDVARSEAWKDAVAQGFYGGRATVKFPNKKKAKSRSKARGRTWKGEE